MDNDFYIEETHPFKIIMICLFIIATTGAIVWAYFNYYQKDNIKLKEVTIELGDKLPTDKESYIEGKNITDYTIDTSNVMLSEEGTAIAVGEYSYKVSKADYIKKGKIFVKDTTAPVVETIPLTVLINEEFSANEFIAKCEDLSNECSASFKDDISKIINQKGEYEVTLIIKDASGNKINTKVKLKVSDKISLAGTKASDLVVDDTSAKDHEWNNTFTIKFDKALIEDNDEFQNKLAEISSADYSNYLPKDKSIANQHLIILYNKYNLVVGISVKLVLNDQTIIFVTD